MAMTCVDQTMVRRGRRLAVLLSAPVDFVRSLASLSWQRHERIEDLSDHVLRDIGFADGRETEAGMRRAAERWVSIDRF